MAKHYRPSIEKFNAPYRGSTDRNDDVNFHLSLVHDLAHLERVSGGNQSYVGHKQQIRNNFSAIYQGEGEITAEMPTAGRLTTNRFDYENKLPTQWTKVSQGTVTKLPGWNTYSLKGLLHQSGIVTLVDAVPGDIIVIRTSIEASVDSLSQFALGATNTLDGQPDLDIYDAKLFIDDARYIEKRIPIDTQQRVELAFYATHGVQGKSDLTLKDFSVSCYNQNTLGVTGMDDYIKIELSRLSKHLNMLNDQYNHK